MRADDRADLGDEERARVPKISRPRLDQPLGRRRAPGCAGRPSRRRRPRGARAGSRPSARRPGPGCARARSGVISSSSVRIGLIFSAPPSQACAAPMRPPRRRYSSVSTANQIFSASRRLARARGDRLDVGAAARRPRRRRARSAPRPPQAELGVDDLDASPRWRSATLRRGLARGLDGAGDRRRRGGSRRCRGPPRAAARRRRGSRRSTAARWSAAARPCAGAS